MLCEGPFSPLEVKVSEAAVRVPPPAGVNLTVSAQVPPAATAEVQVLPASANSAGLPEIGWAEVVMVSGPFPVLVTVKVLSV
jgi:hypothetical protein